MPANTRLPRHLRTRRPLLAVPFSVFNSANSSVNLRLKVSALVAMSMLGACATRPVYNPSEQAMTREALAGTGADRKPLHPAASPLASPPQPADANGPAGSEESTDAGGSAHAGTYTAGADGATTDNNDPRHVAPLSVDAQTVRGSGEMIDTHAARTGQSMSDARQPRGPLADFNFDGTPIQTVVSSVLGDMLHTNYSISQGVAGNVTFSTSRPVDRSQALSILQTLLSWTGNALIRQDGRYVVLPAKEAIKGNLVPGLNLQQPAAGLTARLFPLHYLSATEMQKLLKPFARDDAFLMVDPARNLLAMAGTAEELRNYQHTISIFDVDWLHGMSIGVYSLQHASVAELMPHLQELFGAKGQTPLAGMLRFIPIQRTNAIVVLSPQPRYLDEVHEWISRIDQGGGNQPQLYVYDVANMKASDLARYLRQIYLNASPDDNKGSVAPGLRTTTLSSSGGIGGSSGLSSSNMLNSSGSLGSSNSGLSTSGTSSSASGSSLSSTMGGGTGLGAGTANNASQSDSNDDTSGSGGGNGSNGQSATDPDSNVRITAEADTNQLLVRCRPAQWQEIRDAVRRLDRPPLQVQIETRILEVALTGDLSYGVQWYLGKLAGTSTTTNGVTTQTAGSGENGALGIAGTAYSAGTDAMYYSFVSNRLQVALHALETDGSTRVLSAPSLVVSNNHEATIQVGDNVPITQSSVNTNSSTLTTETSVEYVQTGVILDVTPRINPGGLVSMSIQQQVSDVVGSSTTTTNPTISMRAVSTQVAAKNGQTVLLGGMIQQSDTLTDSGLPYLNRIPYLGRLFGTRSRSRGRTELIVLITPRVINSDSDAAQITDDYERGMKVIQATADGKSAGSASVW